MKRYVKQFEQTNKAKYFSDFKEFVFELSAEDFCDVSGTDVVVSTHYKAKSREFDNVYYSVSENDNSVAVINKSTDNYEI